MLMHFARPDDVSLFTLDLRAPGRPSESVHFATEENLKALFPEAVWQGQAKTAKDWHATYTRRFVSPSELAGMGARVYENVFPK